MTAQRVGRERGIRRPRGKSRLRAAIEETFPEAFASLFEDQSRVERVVREHNRRIEDISSDTSKVKKDTERHRVDITRAIRELDEEIMTARNQLDLRIKQKTRLEGADQPTEVVQTQIEELRGRLMSEQERKSRLTEDLHRLDEDAAEKLQDLEKDRRRIMQDLQEELKEAKRR